MVARLEEPSWQRCGRGHNRFVVFRDGVHACARYTQSSLLSRDANDISRILSVTMFSEYCENSALITGTEDVMPGTGSLTRSWCWARSCPSTSRGCSASTPCPPSSSHRSVASRVPQDTVINTIRNIWRRKLIEQRSLAHHIIIKLLNICHVCINVKMEAP